MEKNGKVASNPWFWGRIRSTRKGMNPSGIWVDLPGCQPIKGMRCANSTLRQISFLIIWKWVNIDIHIIYTCIFTCLSMSFYSKLISFTTADKLYRNGTRKPLQTDPLNYHLLTTWDIPIFPPPSHHGEWRFFCDIPTGDWCWKGGASQIISTWQLGRPPQRPWSLVSAHHPEPVAPRNGRWFFEDFICKQWSDPRSWPASPH